MGKLISRAAAAELLGCTAQTVSNYAAAGLIDEIVRDLKGRRGLFYDPDQLLALAPKLHEISELEARIEEKKAALQEEERKVDQAREEARRDVIRFSGGRKTWNKVRELIVCAYAFAEKVHPRRMSGFEAKVLDHILKLEDFDIICSSLNASSYKVSAAVSSILKKMSKMKDMKTQLDEILEKADKVWEDNRRLQHAYDLQTALADVSAGLPANLSGKEFELARKLLPYRSMYVSSLGLSSRARSALETLGVHTVFDLAGIREEDFKFVRGVGEKTIEEIRGVLSFLGLDFGMHDLGRKVTRYDYLRYGSLKDYL